MLYKKLKSTTVNVNAPPVTGANVSLVHATVAATQVFYAWMPSTWPIAPASFSAEFLGTVKLIFNEAILSEIKNVISDIKKSHGDLKHRGHVVAISMMCALDAISSYPYRNKNVSKFISAHFPVAYRQYANDFYNLYRTSMVHSWNLFEASILPETEAVSRGASGSLCFGLLNFSEALSEGVTDFLVKLESDAKLQQNTLERYRELRKTARA